MYQQQREGGEEEIAAQDDDFWSEENTSVTDEKGDDDYTHGDFVEAEGHLEADIAYGGHGNFSYNCDEDEDKDYDLDQTKETENRPCRHGEDPSYTNSNGDKDECHHYAVKKMISAVLQAS